MPQPRGPGRPKSPLRRDVSSLTLRVRSLIDAAHQGNLRQAAEHAGVPYGTVRDLYVGRSEQPALQTLQTLSAAYDLSLEWFLRGDSEPPTAVTGILPPDPEIGRGRVRRIEIPLAAWPLARLFLVLEPYLRSLPPGRSRPILGGAADPQVCRQRFTEFLLAPLIEAQEQGLLLLIGADPPFRGAERVSSDQRREWIEILRRLGECWSAVLSGLLQRAARR